MIVHFVAAEASFGAGAIYPETSHYRLDPLSLMSNSIPVEPDLDAGPMIQVGAAKFDITPGYPARLSGYGKRAAESDGVEQRLWAKALALGEDAEGASVLLTVDNVGVPAHVTEAVFERLAGRAGLVRENFVICSSHTHCAPMLEGVLPNLFCRDLPDEEREGIARYTRELIDWLEAVALAALAERTPARLRWAIGSATFAANRRTPGGPVDHAMPLLAAMSADGSVRAILANYACHCTTLGGNFNRCHGDWAGAAQEAIERDHPGAIAMISIGCGGDANPHPRGTLADTRDHGRQIAGEVNRLLSGQLRPLAQNPRGRMERMALPFDPLPTVQEWEERRVIGTIHAYHAGKNLDRIARGETLPEALPYSVQTWTFGEDLAMVFLPGEVVVDYALRLKSDFDPARLWLNAYANDVPCYIPSRRILNEGGYEAELSQCYYDRPARLSPDIEELIIEAVHSQVPPLYRRRSQPATSPAPSAGTP